jgi:hypothetical protein
VKAVAPETVDGVEYVAAVHGAAVGHPPPHGRAHRRRPLHLPRQRARLSLEAREREREFESSRFWIFGAWFSFMEWLTSRVDLKLSGSRSMPDKSGEGESDKFGIRRWNLMLAGLV